MNFVVLINNEIQYEGRYPLLASYIKNEWRFYKTISRGSTQDITETFQKGLQLMFTDSPSHYLKPFTTRRSFTQYFSYESNEVLQILNIKSEIHEIQVQLHRNYKNGRKLILMNLDKGEQTDVTEFFLKDRERFLTLAFVAFSKLIAHFELVRNRIVLSNVYHMGIAFIVDNKRWMNLINIDVSVIDNPFHWIMDEISYSKISPFFMKNEVQASYEDPYIFAAGDKGGHITYYTATTKDFLSFMNVNLPRPLDLRSPFLVQLFAVCCLRSLGFEVRTNMLPTVAPYFVSIADGTVTGQSFNREQLTGDIVERSILLQMLTEELVHQFDEAEANLLVGELIPNFERMRLV